MECKTCGKHVTDFKELIRHILSNSKTHPAWQVKWAGKATMNVEYLDRKVTMQKQFEGGKVPLTEQEKENKQDAKRVLCGIEKTVLCKCPACKTKFPTRIPVEYVESPSAWKDKDGKTLIVSCFGCRK